MKRKYGQYKTAKKKVRMKSRLYSQTEDALLKNSREYDMIL